MIELLSESEFSAQRVPLNASLKAKNGTLTGIVTYIKADKGYYAVSRYEDDLWVFPRSSGTSAMNDARRKLNFRRFKDPIHRCMAKWVIWNGLKEGRSINTLRAYLSCLFSYFKWVNQSEVVAESGLNAYTASEYVKYINSLISNHGKRKGKPLAIDTKAQRFWAVESLYVNCKHFDFVKEHPWFGSSFMEQAGNVGQVRTGRQNKPQTDLIPDDILKSLCDFTKSYLDRADELLTYKEHLDEFVPTSDSVAYRSTQRKNYLHTLGYEGSLQSFNEELVILRDSCLCWIMLTTGMRIHEVLAIKCGLGLGYRTETIDDVVFYYVKSVSKKTYEGEAEWIAPKIAIDAIDILERYTSSLQATLLEQLDIANNENNVEEVERLVEISGSVGLPISSSESNKISILSGATFTEYRCHKLCSLANINWNLTPHQFRRTFANHAVHSELGDLRALRDHFKHWSLSMTALYAANPDLDRELFEEVLRERYLVEDQISNDWFSLEMPITGGRAAQQSLEIRASDEKVKTYSSRTEMVKSFTSSISFRSTGLGWCINDDGTCMKSCDDCDDGIVDCRHIKHWESMLIQQLELSETQDIGRAGQHAVQLGLDRCKKVLTDLGVDVESIQQKFINRDKVA